MARALLTIQQALQGFATANLKQVGTELLAALGYQSDRTIELSPNTFAGFYQAFAYDTPRFNPDGALAEQWQQAEILCQVTDEELSGAQTLFAKNALERDRFNSLLFMAIALKGSHYSRTALAKITREVNKCFAMPVVIIFRYGNHPSPLAKGGAREGGAVTLAVIHRRGHQRDQNQDVLEKVTLIKDVRLASPHRAHLEILADLALSELARRQGHRIANFETLLAAWQEVLDTSELNKRFYQELVGWYFWALQHAKFPNPPEAGGVKDEERRAVALIRLITRLIFVWFLKEKELVPETLFDKALINQHLKSEHQIDTEGSIYYRAILQNLFFATLNTDMNRDQPGSRGFKEAGQAGQRYNTEYMAHTRYRYRSYFQDPAAALTLFENIPFLNGGLFECLDRAATESADGKEERLDGFSDDPRKQAALPDLLFFGEEDIDLSEVYGASQRRLERVRGIINIFERYKFTINENTPIEEEVALDPELLGKVFENLLASYNPETRTTARKQTGSFYTPREIVNYMVDEALMAYLGTKLKESPPSPPLEKGESPRPTATPLGKEAMEDEAERKLRALFAYDDQPHPFSDDEVTALIDAIDNLKVLDPACGSGAFPMGILGRLVTILGKLDPQNERWKAQQLEREIAPVLADIQTAQRISYDQAREQAIRQLEVRLAEIQRAFEENDHDYARKLFLIENCIYGVDIQPIAVQIAKLRCFIALIVNQRVDKTKPNRGMLALPNLETKFVAANTLLGIDKPSQGMFEDPDLIAKQAELRKLRHEHFQARRWADKKKLRQKDQQLRQAIAGLLKRDIFTNNDGVAEKLAHWNPYDQNASADFFDAEWMFGIAGGFDIVIGNPPYVRQEQIKELKPRLQTQFECYTGVADLYVYFFEKGVKLLRERGMLAYISSNSFLNAGFAQKLRNYLATQTRLVQLIDFGETPVFDATTEPCILILRRDLPQTNDFAVLRWAEGKRPNDIAATFSAAAFRIAQSKLAADGWRLERDNVQALLEKLRSAGTPLGEYVGGRFYRGILTGFNEAFVVDRATRDRLIAEHESSAEVLKPFLRGRDVKRWRVNFAEQYLIKLESSENKIHPWSRKPDAEAEKIFAQTYPAIYNHFENYREQMIKRYDQGKYFWELRACAYWQEFEQPKIVYQEINRTDIYAYDSNGHFTNNKLFIIPEASLYLLALLNSKLLGTFFIHTFSGVPVGGFLALQTPIMSAVPVVDASPKQQELISNLVSHILTAKEHDAGADVSALERQIDELVYELYGLTDEEIAVVEGVR